MCKVSRKLQFTKDITPYTLPPVLFSSLFRFLGKVLAQCTSHVVETGKSCRDMLDSQFDYDRWAHGQRRSGHEVGKHVSSLSELLFHFRIFFEACFSKRSLFSQFLRTAAILRSLACTYQLLPEHSKNQVLREILSKLATNIPVARKS